MCGDVFVELAGFFFRELVVQAMCDEFACFFNIHGVLRALWKSLPLPVEIRVSLGISSSQLLRQSQMRPMNPHPHRTECHSHHLGRVLVAEALELHEHQRLSEIFGEGIHRFADAADFLAGFRCGCGAGVGRGTFIKDG